VGKDVERAVDDLLAALLVFAFVAVWYSTVLFP
jgi:hypothetical protein